MNKDIYFINPGVFEYFDFNSPETTGIGGSETAIIELSRGLGKLEYNVTVFAHIKEDKLIDSEGNVTWFPLKIELVDIKAPGTWIISRSPGTIDLFDPLPTQRFFLLCQDVDYVNEDKGGIFTEERVKKFEKIIGLCKDHIEFLGTKYPYMKDKLVLSSNGIKSEKIRKVIEENKEERNQFRMIWTSDMSRGLETLLKIFSRTREYEPRLELHVFYGWNNTDKIIEKNPHGELAQLKQRILEMPQDNVFWRGRIGQVELWKEYLKSNLWVYSTVFKETNSINSQECQALGCIPICSNLWALKDKIHHGVLIDGNVSNSVIQSRYVQTILELINNPIYCNMIGLNMSENALEKFNWNNIVIQYNEWIKNVN